MMAQANRQRAKGVKTVLTWLASLMLLTSLHAFAQSTNSVTYVYTDPQGTPLAEADASGNITATFEYTPYGTFAPTGTSNPGADPKGPGYTGHVNDPETNLVYMQARYYDPATGRVLSVDPVTPSPGNTFNFNRYAYASNNPILNVDPNGKESASLTLQGVAAIQSDQDQLTQGQIALGLSAETAILVGPLAPDLAAAIRTAVAVKTSESNPRANSSGGNDSANGVTHNVGGIQVGNTPSTARQSLEDAGHPGTPTTNESGTETGTIHTIADKKMDVRVMDGGANHGPRIVTNRTGNPKQPVDPQTGRNFGNIPKEDQRAQSHIPLSSNPS
jgi:RHS repeat-associated protein